MIQASLLIKGQYSLTYIIFCNYFDGFHENFCFDFICVFYQILFKRKYKLTSAIVSLKRILNILNIETFFNIALFNNLLMSYFIMAWLLETFGNKDMEETALLDWTASWNFTVYPNFSTCNFLQSKMDINKRPFIWISFSTWSHRSWAIWNNFAWILVENSFQL